MGKEEAQRKHAKSRSTQRFGVAFTREAEKEILEKIKTGRATFIEKQSNRVSLFGVIYCGKETVVVYDRHRGTIVTLMSRDMFEGNKQL